MIQEDDTKSEASTASFYSTTSSCSNNLSEKFKPINFPPSESFSPPRFVPKILPGVRPARESPFDNNGDPADDDEQRHSESLQNTSDIGEPDTCNTLCHCLFAILVLVLAMLVALLIANKNEYTVSPLFMYPFDKSIMPMINQNIVGQSQAVYSILNTLKNMTYHHPETNSWCRVLLLVGGPGVGKDYTIQNIKEHFYSIGGSECKENSHHTLFPDVLREVQFCWRRDYNIYSFDTLYSKDESQIQKTVDTLQFISRICKDYNKRAAFMVPVLPVKVYSLSKAGREGVDVVSSSTEYFELVKREGLRLQKILKNAKVSSEVILFRPISWNDLKTCIIHSAQQQGRSILSSATVDEIVSMIKPSDNTEVDFVPAGCKDVDALVALLPPRVSTEF